MALKRQVVEVAEDCRACRYLQEVNPAIGKGADDQSPVETLEIRVGKRAGFAASPVALSLATEQKILRLSPSDRHADQ